MKKFLTWVCLAVFMVAGIYACVTMAAMPRTYDGQNATVSVYELRQDPSSYDDSTADGAAAVIVQQNLEKTHAVNDVTSIVFDFRGYDTMGEAFLLITAVAGVTVLLRKTEAEKLEDRKNGKKQ
ncbi:MAG: hydrogen gas-evolving membrane-bound hydrogenase subunit E [Candidatus Limivicinus sp.]